jgi:polyisoprenoid-binding protein YceI
MHKKFRAIVVISTLVALATTVGATEPPSDKAALSKDISTVPSGTYVLEHDHARVVWKISHHGFSRFQAILPKISGTLQFDSARPERSHVDVTIDMAAAVSGIAVFDQRMADPKWNIFKSQQFPTATFRSTAIKRRDANRFSVTGDLNFLGVTKPLTLEATFNQAGAGLSMPKNYRLGFDATAVMKRYDWGNTAYETLGDEVQLEIEAEFIKP